MRSGSILLSLLLTLTFMAGFSQATEIDPAYAELKNEARHITESLVKGDYKEARRKFNSQMQQALPPAKLKVTWQGLATGSGGFIETGQAEISRYSGYIIIEQPILFEHSALIQRTVFGQDNLVAGLMFIPHKTAGTACRLPAGLEELEVEIESQPNRPLKGTLTKPAGQNKAAVIIIHGSGPIDRDGSLGANKPYRDMAHKLAQKGLAVIRYDKMTYTYRSEAAQNPKPTVDEEIVTDIVNVGKWLRKQEGLETGKIFLMGHSFSGSLLSYADTKGAGAAGYIIWSGTPANLFSIIQRQNEALFAEMAAAGNRAEKEKAFLAAEAEMAKAMRLPQMREDELLSQSIFGIPGWYWKHLAAIDPVRLHLADGKPVLIIHGGRDRQVFMEDFQAWQTGLGGHPKASFILYDNLNHILGNYQGGQVPFSQLVSVEYARETPIPDYVTDDIYNWIAGQCK